ncbi:MAG: S6e family ribosomal protein [Nanoarchaeota archaeon]
MVVKFIIGDKGKAWRVEMPEADFLHGKNVGDTIPGKDLKAELEGYDLEITGGSDSSGFPLNKNIEGIALKKLLLTKGFGMQDNYDGIRRRKTFRGKTISGTIAQVNLKVVKHGHKKFEEVFPEQNSGKVEVKAEVKKA